MAGVFAPYLQDEEDDITLYTNPISNVGKSVETILNHVAKGKFKITTIDLFKQEHKKEEFTKINPMQQVPALMFNGTMLNESNSINRFLADYYKLHDLYPQDPSARHRVDTLMDLQGNMVRPKFLGAARAVIFP